jgi:hypothetical protein
MNDFTVAHDHLVYVVFDAPYGSRRMFQSVFTTHELAERAIEAYKELDAEGGYARSYEITPVRLNAMGA